MILCAVVLLGTYTFLPPLLGNLFGASIKNEMGLQTTPDVSLQSEPPPTLLVGNFSQGQVSLGESDFGDVRPRRVTIDLDPFDLNVLKSFGNGEFVSQEPLSGNVRMEVAEKEVTRIASSAAEDISIERVDLEKDRVTVRSGTRVLGIDVPVVVRGELAVEGQDLTFEPNRVSAFGVEVPDRLSEELLSEADFSYPMEDMPYDANVSGVEVEKDYLVISGRLERIPLDGGSG